MNGKLISAVVAVIIVGTLGVSVGVASASPPQWQPVYAAPSLSAPSVGATDTEDDFDLHSIECWVRGAHNQLWLRVNNQRHNQGVAFSGYIGGDETMLVPANAKDGQALDGFPGCPPVSDCNGHAGHVVQIPVPFQPNASFYVDPSGCRLRHVPTAQVYFCLVNTPQNKGYGVRDDKVQTGYVLSRIFHMGPAMSCQYPVPTGSSWHPF